MTVTTYLATLQPDVRRAVRGLRVAIRAAAPGAVDGISYGIPCVKIDGRPVVWYAGWKQHTSMYPIGATLLHAHGIDSKGYAISKGTIKFPLTSPPTPAFVKRLVKARLAQWRKETAGR